jgi:hypothetical protein
MEIEGKELGVIEADGSLDIVGTIEGNSDSPGRLAISVGLSVVTGSVGASVTRDGTMVGTSLGTSLGNSDSAGGRFATSDGLKVGEATGREVVITTIGSRGPLTTPVLRCCSEAAECSWARRRWRMFRVAWTFLSPSLWRMISEQLEALKQVRREMMRWGMLPIVVFRLSRVGPSVDLRTVEAFLFESGCWNSQRQQEKANPETMIRLIGLHG